MKPRNGTAARGETLLQVHKLGFARGYLGQALRPPSGWREFTPIELEAFASGWKCDQREAALDKQRPEAFHRDCFARRTPRLTQEMTR